MARKEKLLKKVLSGSKNVRFAEFMALMETFGFRLERISGSHHIFFPSRRAAACECPTGLQWSGEGLSTQAVRTPIEKYDLTMDEHDENVEGE